MTGQAEQATALAEKMGDLNLFSPAEQVKLAKQLLGGKHKDRARELILALVRSGKGGIIDNPYQFHALFKDRQSCEQLVKALEQMPRKPEVVENGTHWINNFTQSIRQAARGKKGEELNALHDMELRVAKLADQFSSVPTRYTNQPHNRQHLSYVTRQLRQYKSTQEAYDYLRQSIFEADKTGLPEPSVSQLFAHTGTRNNKLQCLATMLVLNAHESNSLDELDELVAKRRKQDATWSQMGLRFAALIALQREDVDLAAKLVREVIDNPIINPVVGYDSSIAYFVHRTAKHESMADLTMEQVDLLMSTMAGNRNASNQIHSIGPMIVLIYAKSGDTEKTKAAIEQAFNIMSLRYRNNNQYIVRQMLALCRLVGSIHRDNNRTALAADYYRVLLRFPFHRANTLTGDTTRGNLPDIIIRLIKQLKKDGELDGYIEHLQEQRKRIGGDNAEPLITLATCRIIQGRLADARATLKKIGEGDYIAGAPLLVHAIQKLPEDTRLEAIALIDPMFSRSPYLFNKEVNRLLAMYGSAKRPLPVSDQIKELLAEISSSTTQSSSRRNRGNQGRRGRLGTNPAILIEFDGSADVPGAKIPSPEDRAELTRQMLTEMAKHFERIKDEDALLALVDWAYPYLDKQKIGPQWIMALRKKDPTKSYDAALKMLNHSDKTLNVQALFKTGLAKTILELAHELDRMGELAKACKAGTPAMARLRLLIVAVQDADRFKGMLPDFLENQPPYTLDQKTRSLSKGVDPALPLLIEVCPRINPKLKSHLPALFDTAIKANEKYVAKLEKQYPDRDHYFIDSKPWLQMIQVQFELGDSTVALDTSRRLLDKHMKKASSVGGIQYRGDARGDMSTMADFANKHNATAEMTELLIEIKKQAVDIDGMSEAFTKPLSLLTPSPVGVINE
jgi:tetratricopeptide (TPR) repeat protein